MIFYSNPDEIRNLALSKSYQQPPSQTPRLAVTAVCNELGVRAMCNLLEPYITRIKENEVVGVNVLFRYTLATAQKMFFVMLTVVQMQELCIRANRKTALVGRLSIGIRQQVMKSMIKPTDSYTILPMRRNGKLLLKSIWFTTGWLCIRGSCFMRLRQFSSGITLKTRA